MVASRGVAVSSGLATELPATKPTVQSGILFRQIATSSKVDGEKRN